MQWNRNTRHRAARLAAASAVLPVCLLALGGSPGTAGASTLNGVAVIAEPGLTTPLTQGGSTTQFTVALPAQAACTGDTASDGYHVYSYLVPEGTNLSSLTFIGHPSTGYGLYENTPKYWGAQNTAPVTGQIIGIPNNFEWASANIPLATLLFTGTGSSATGVWEAGIACANSSGALTDNWNIEVTFAASSGDADGFTWSTGGTPPPTTTTTTTTSSTTTTTAPTGTTTTTTGAGATTTTTDAGSATTTTTIASGVAAASTTDSSTGGGADGTSAGTDATDPTTATSQNLPYTGFHTVKGLGVGLLGIGLGFMLLGWGYRKKIRPARLARRSTP